MATVEEYRRIVQELLEAYRGPQAPADDVETQLIADVRNDHYQLVNVGWEHEHRVYGCILHIDIRDDKIWVQHNMMEQRVAEDLAALGIPRDRIVVGFHPQSVRKFTEFAVN